MHKPSLTYTLIKTLSALHRKSGYYRRKIVIVDCCVVFFKDDWFSKKQCTLLKHVLMNSTRSVYAAFTRIIPTIQIDITVSVLL